MLSKSFTQVSYLDRFDEHKSPAQYQQLIPWLLVLCRPLLGMFSILIAWFDLPRWLWLLQFIAAIVSDIYDGKLARRWGVATEKLRRADSLCDDIYAFSSLACFWIAEPGIIADHAIGLVALITIDFARNPLDWFLFGKRASYHSTSMRLFGLSLIPVGLLIMMFGEVYFVFWLSLTIGIAAELEGVAISLVLPTWTHDVKHIGKAIAIRRASQAGSKASQS
ncbi:MAG: CDP-alcohol phosphatidyltransferase family protein [Planctomycetaceae bacterium]